MPQWPLLTGLQAETAIIAAFWSFPPVQAGFVRADIEAVPVAVGLDPLIGGPDGLNQLSTIARLPELG